MRVIKAPTTRELKQSCRECKTQVALEPGDLKFVADPRDGNAVVWKCPTCSHENWIAVSRIPESFRRLVTGFSSS